MPTAICKIHFIKFELIDGCPLCLTERRSAGIRPEQDEMEDGLNSEGLTLIKERTMTNIVKVRYYSERTGGLSEKEYSYLSEIKLDVGDIVIVPVRDTSTKACVSAIDVPEIEVASFKDRLKTITTIKDEPSEKEALETTPGTDLEVLDWHTESLRLLEYATARTITTLEAYKDAIIDLSLISKIKKDMDERRKFYIKPHDDAKKAIMATYKNLMEPIENADILTRQKMVIYNREQERIRLAQEEVNRLRMDAAKKEMELKGEVTEPVNLVEVLPKTHKTIATDLGSSSQRDNWKYEVVDINLVPREYLMINSGMLTPIVKASKGRIPIPGIRIYNEPVIATRVKVAALKSDTQ